MEDVENTAQRTRNRRGEGARLRGEILAAAAALLEQTGSVDAITLRGVARQAGVSAPSIYAHFADREEIVAAVIGDAFAELDDALAAAVERAGVGGDPRQRVRALCEAYLDFAEAKPQRYRVAFDRYSGREEQRAERVDDLLGGRAFTRLVEGVRAEIGTGVGADAQFEATVLWVGLHGYASLSASVPAFPWPGRGDVVAALVGRVGAAWAR